MNIILKSLCLGIIGTTLLTGCQTVNKTKDKITSVFDKSRKIPEIDKKGVVDLSKKTYEQIEKFSEKMPVDQWVYLENKEQGLYDLQNKNKDGVILSLRLICKISSQKPAFILKDKEDKEILKAYDNTTGQPQFLLDNKNYLNPFDANNPKKLEVFKAAMSKAKVLKIYYSSTLYTFQNGKSELLEKAVTCKE
ncbi:hypothetical protein [Acinetobacter stercoris]|uniref:Lipoprotein n=1 Tax=Acinetobacter stercoris TaxID=2126983 RepID=A0A2U3MVI9_9GAMM|nr:hypothetical protein [Acinetobacter stercoris]SPL69458.1 hypothetical protein KPC_0636 [Acinetobacter stercoris]